MNNLVEAMDKIWGKGAYENIKWFVFLKKYLSFLFVSGLVIALANNDLFGCLPFKDVVRSIFPRVRERTVGFT